MPTASRSASVSRRPSNGRFRTPRTGGGGTRDANVHAGMRVLCVLRAVAVLVVACAVLRPSPARAQAAPAEIEVRVTDVAAHPLADARVYVSGPLSTSQLTPRDGVIRFSDVDPGLYHVRVTLTGYDSVDAEDVEALSGQRKIVEISLTRTVPKGARPTPAPEDLSGLREIGRVRARPAVTMSAVDVDEGSPVRRISENLADALDKIAGVSVISGQQGNTLTISLRNADPTQTGTSIGGATVVGAGTGTLQAVAVSMKVHCPEFRTGELRE